jgi:uncharacterized membrane protein
MTDADAISKRAVLLEVGRMAGDAVRWCLGGIPRAFSITIRSVVAFGLVAACLWASVQITPVVWQLALNPPSAVVAALNFLWNLVAVIFWMIILLHAVWVIWDRAQARVMRRRSDNADKTEGES